MKEKNDKGVNCMVSNIHSMGLFGMDAFPVEVEADLSSGLPAFEIVGLPDASVRESICERRAEEKEFIRQDRGLSEPGLY